MAKNIQNNECCFEEWNSAKKAMDHCHNQATHTMAGHKLCEFHARYAQSIRAMTSKSAAQDLEEIRK